jgi:hypothetical protein
MGPFDYQMPGARLIGDDYLTLGPFRMASYEYRPPPRTTIPWPQPDYGAHSVGIPELYDVRAHVEPTVPDIGLARYAPYAFDLPLQATSEPNPVARHEEPIPEPRPVQYDDLLMTAFVQEQALRSIGPAGSSASQADMPCGPQVTALAAVDVGSAATSLERRLEVPVMAPSSSSIDGQIAVGGARLLGPGGPPAGPGVPVDPLGCGPGLDGLLDPEMLELLRLLPR